MKLQPIDGFLSLRRQPPVRIPAFVLGAAYVGTQNVVDARRDPVVVCASTPHVAAPETFKEQHMNLTLKGLSKNGKAAFYAGAATVLRFSLAAFPNRTAPESIEVADGAFAAARTPKAKMTKEERKAANAAKPKPTLAEKIAREEKRLAALKAKADTEAANAPQL